MNRYLQMGTRVVAGVVSCALFLASPAAAGAYEGANSYAYTDEALWQGYGAAVPTTPQFDYQKEELSAFCHFGPNTFNEVEWGDRYGSRSPEDIFPLRTQIDAYEYVRVLQQAGFKRLIVTAKHHDGFCIWRSAYTDYDVESTAYPGDVLAQLSEACSYYGMAMGLYLSPWDIHEKSYGYYDENGRATDPAHDALDYNEFYNNQLKEILSDDRYGCNGRFVEIWLDGAKGEGANAQDYDLKLWGDTIRAYEGDCLIFGGDFLQTVRWIGNERGYAADTTWAQGYYVDAYGNRVGSLADAARIDSNKKNGYTYGYQNGNAWTVPECDARITSGWFWGTRKNTPKSMNELTDMYFGSVGHGGVLLLNVPLNDLGGVDAQILSRVEEFGQALNDSFGQDLAAGAYVSADSSVASPEAVTDDDDRSVWAPDATTGSITIDLGSEREFDIVSIEEAIQYGQRISSYRVECSMDGVRFATMETGNTVGAKRLCRTGVARARYVRVTVSVDTGSRPVLNKIGVYKAAKAFENGSVFTADALNDIPAFVFPEETGSGYTRTLEAENARLFNSGMSERYPLEYREASWASGGRFVNACNEGDYITYEYEAAQAGTYEVRVVFRSGDERNGFTISEENGRIVPVTVTAGAADHRTTCAQTFLLQVRHPGKGVLKLSAGDYKAPQLDCFDVTLVEKDDYFVFPDTTGNRNVLEAESARLYNSYNGTGSERYVLGYKDAAWASNGRFVNSCNEGDYITFHYDAPAAGTYEVVLTYRSGDVRNSFTITEENGKIEPVTVTAGARNASETHTQTFVLTVLQPGTGTMKLSAGPHKAPQMDRFDITNR